MLEVKKVVCNRSSVESALLELEKSINGPDGQCNMGSSCSSIVSHQVLPTLRNNNVRHDGSNNYIDGMYATATHEHLQTCRDVTAATQGVVTAQGCTSTLYDVRGKTWKTSSPYSDQSMEICVHIAVIQHFWQGTSYNPAHVWGIVQTGRETFRYLLAPAIAIICSRFAVHDGLARLKVNVEMMHVIRQGACETATTQYTQCTTIHDATDTNHHSHTQ